MMNLPEISLASLPELDQAAGLFGSLSQVSSAIVDDRILILMVYVYEVAPPEAVL